MLLISQSFSPFLDLSVKQSEEWLLPSESHPNPFLLYVAVVSPKHSVKKLSGPSDSLFVSFRDHLSLGVC